jgi:uncharacterized protein involved in exopolysaccharide biosynthesis
MPTAKQNQKKPRFVRRALARHWRLAGMVAVSVLLLTLLGIMVLPRIYSSEARLAVRFGPENLTLDPTATTGQMISIDASRENEINSLLEVLRSRAMLDRLVESLGPDYVLTGRGEPKPFQAAAASATNEPTAAHQEAVQHLERNIEVSVPRQSNIISVQCQANSPALAQKITARLVEIYLDEHARIQRTAGSQQALVDQTQLSKTESQAAASRFEQEKDKLGIAAIDGKKQQIHDEITDIDAKLLANRSDLKTAEARIASLQEQIASLPEKLVTQEARAPNAASDNMRAALFQLESLEQELASTRSDNHPQLVAVRQQLKDLRTPLHEQPSQRAQATQTVNPSRQALELSLLNEQSQAAALRGREKSLVAQAARLRGELKQLNAQQASLGQLEQEVELAEGRHKADADKLEQARINRSNDDGRISSLTVVQPATFPTSPAGPKRAYVLALGLIVAALSGLGTALFAAYLQPVLTTRIELEELWDLPLVGVLPRLERRMAAAS